MTAKANLTVSDAIAGHTIVRIVAGRASKLALGSGIAFTSFETERLEADQVLLLQLGC